MEHDEKEKSSKVEFKRVFPQVFLIHTREDECGNEFYIPMDNGGHIITKSEFIDFSDKVKLFYKTHSNRKIAHLQKMLDFNDPDIELDSQEPEKRIIRSGYIYFFEGGGFIKIGKTKHLNSRTGFLEIKMPFECNFIHSVKTNDMKSCENYFHKMFASNRTNGEWFKLSENDIIEAKKTTVLNF